MHNYSIITSSVDTGRDGSQNFAFRRDDHPNVIWGIENFHWSEEESSVVADIAIFREQMEDGQIVANQIYTEDPQYNEFIKVAEEVINMIIDDALKAAEEVIGEQ